MRITNTMRESILVKETDKKFKDKLEVAYQELLKEIENEVKTFVPKNFDYSLVADGWVRTCCEVNVLGIRENGKSEDFSLNSSYPCGINCYTFEFETTKKITSAYQKYKKIEDERSKFKCDLRKILYGFTIHKQLIAHIPEFENYFTPEQKAQNLSIVPVELIKDFRKQLSK